MDFTIARHIEQIPTERQEASIEARLRQVEINLASQARRSELLETESRFATFGEVE